MQSNDAMFNSMASFGTEKAPVAHRWWHLEIQLHLSTNNKIEVIYKMS